MDLHLVEWSAGDDDDENDDEEEEERGLAWGQGLRPLVGLVPGDHPSPPFLGGGGV